MYNERLYSREGAAELLGISVSTLADYELGNTKVVPVDKVVLMADLYNAPELKTGYCKHECPICSYLPVATEAKGLEGITLLFLVVGEANPRTGGSRKERTCMQAERTG
nr:helix-turn-helix transcriptional regulator [Blautia sp. NSJ-166]